MYYQIYTKPHSEHVQMTLECHIILCLESIG